MAHEDIDITGHYLMIDGTRIYYEECGEGIPLVCIHSAGSCTLLYFDFLRIMGKKGFRAIAIDLPGHGKSYPVNWQPFRVMHEYAEFAWKIIQAICAGEKPVVMGCATGGELVTDLACHHSADMRAVLALEGPARPAPFPDLNIYEDPHACPGWRNIMERAAIEPTYRPFPEERRIELRWVHRYACQEIAAGDLQCWAKHDVRDKLKDVKCPYLAFKGEADYYIPEELLDEAVDGIPDGLGEKMVGKEMGHFPVFEKPEAMAEIALDFLKKREII